MTRPALAAKTKEAIREAAVEVVRQRGKATPQEVVNALAKIPGPWYRIKLTPHRLGAILRGETRIGLYAGNHSSGYRYIWRGD